MPGSKEQAGTVWSPPLRAPFAFLPELKVNIESLGSFIRFQISGL